MAHTCNALVIHCMDFRFGSAIKGHLEDQALLDDCDIVSLAGAAKNIAAPSSDADLATAMKQVELSKKLHDIKTVVLMNHTDCGAYGGRKAFADRDVERAQHTADMEKAGEAIRAKYPDLQIRIVLADIEEDGSINFLT
jgi:carbonic anhydrase